MLQFVAIAVTDLPAKSEMSLTLHNSDGGSICWSNGELQSGATGIMVQGADDTPFALQSLTVTGTTIALVNGGAKASFDIFAYIRTPGKATLAEGTLAVSSPGRVSVILQASGPPINPAPGSAWVLPYSFE
jgi:hypothetical protein